MLLTGLTFTALCPPAGMVILPFCTAVDAIKGAYTLVRGIQTAMFVGSVIISVHGTKHKVNAAFDAHTPIADLHLDETLQSIKDLVNQEERFIAVAQAEQVILSEQLKMAETQRKIYSRLSQLLNADISENNKKEIVTLINQIYTEICAQEAPINDNISDSDLKQQLYDIFKKNSLDAVKDELGNVISELAQRTKTIETDLAKRNALLKEAEQGKLEGEIKSYSEVKAAIKKSQEAFVANAPKKFQQAANALFEQLLDEHQIINEDKKELSDQIFDVLEGVINGFAGGDYSEEGWFGFGNRDNLREYLKLRTGILQYQHDVDKFSRALTPSAEVELKTDLTKLPSESIAIDEIDMNYQLLQEETWFQKGTLSKLKAYQNQLKDLQETKEKLIKQREKNTDRFDAFSDFQIKYINKELYKEYLDKNSGKTPEANIVYIAKHYHNDKENKSKLQYLFLDEKNQIQNGTIEVRGEHKINKKSGKKDPGSRLQEKKVPIFAMINKAQAGKSKIPVSQNAQSKNNAKAASKRICKDIKKQFEKESFFKWIINGIASAASSVFGSGKTKARKTRERWYQNMFSGEKFTDGIHNTIEKKNQAEQKHEQCIEKINRSIQDVEKQIKIVREIRQQTTKTQDDIKKTYLTLSSDIKKIKRSREILDKKASEITEIAKPTVDNIQTLQALELEISRLDLSQQDLQHYFSSDNTQQVTQEPVNQQMQQQHIALQAIKNEFDNLLQQAENLGLTETQKQRIHEAKKAAEDAAATEGMLPTFIPQAGKLNLALAENSSALAEKVNAGLNTVNDIFSAAAENQATSATEAGYKKLKPIADALGIKPQDLNEQDKNYDALLDKLQQQFAKIGETIDDTLQGDGGYDELTQARQALAKLAKEKEAINAITQEVEDNLENAQVLSNNITDEVNKSRDKLSNIANVYADGCINTLQGLSKSVQTSREEAKTQKVQVQQEAKQDKSVMTKQAEMSFIDEIIDEVGTNITEGVDKFLSMVLSEDYMSNDQLFLSTLNSLEILLAQLESDDATMRDKLAIINKIEDPIEKASNLLILARENKLISNTYKAELCNIRLRKLRFSKLQEQVDREIHSFHRKSKGNTLTESDIQDYKNKMQYYRSQINSNDMSHLQQDKDKLAALMEKMSTNAEDAERLIQEINTLTGKGHTRGLLMFKMIEMEAQFIEAMLKNITLQHGASQTPADLYIAKNIIENCIRIVKYALYCENFSEAEVNALSDILKYHENTDITLLQNLISEQRPTALTNICEQVIKLFLDQSGNFQQELDISQLIALRDLLQSQLKKPEHKNWEIQFGFINARQLNKLTPEMQAGFLKTKFANIQLKQPDGSEKENNSKTYNDVYRICLDILTYAIHTEFGDDDSLKALHFALGKERSDIKTFTLLNNKKMPDALRRLCTNIILEFFDNHGNFLSEVDPDKVKRLHQNLEAIITQENQEAQLGNLQAKLSNWGAQLNSPEQKWHAWHDKNNSLHKTQSSTKQHTTSKPVKVSTFKFSEALVSLFQDGLPTRESSDLSEDNYYAEVRANLF